MHAYIHTYRQIDRHIYIQTHRRTDRRQTDRQTDRQTNVQYLFSNREVCRTLSNIFDGAFLLKQLLLELSRPYRKFRLRLNFVLYEKTCSGLVLSALINYLRITYNCNVLDPDRYKCFVFINVILSRHSIH